jgi:hypothetical protein
MFQPEMIFIMSVFASMGLVGFAIAWKALNADKVSPPPLSLALAIIAALLLLVVGVAYVGHAFGPGR